MRIWSVNPIIKFVIVMYDLNKNINFFHLKRITLKKIKQYSQKISFNLIINWIENINCW